MAGKTVTQSRLNIRERSLYVYLPSKELADAWKRKAEQSKVSISKFVVEHVEDSLRQEEGLDSAHLSRAELAKQLREKEEQLGRTCRDLEMYRQLSERLDTDLKRYRSQSFLEEGFQGIRRYDRELVNLLKSQSSVSNETILSSLNIDPADTVLVKSVTVQLDNLQSYGLVEATSRGWRWKTRS